MCKSWYKKRRKNEIPPKDKHTDGCRRRVYPQKLPGWEVDLGTATMLPAVAVLPVMVMLWRFLTAAIAPRKVSGGGPNALRAATQLPESSNQKSRSRWMKSSVPSSSTHADIKHSVGLKKTNITTTKPGQKNEDECSINCTNHVNTADNNRNKYPHATH